MIHTNTVEGYFSVFKRGMRGTYQHCKERHCTGILASSIFATTTASRSAWTISSGRRSPCEA